MILLLMLNAWADPVALRSPARGDLAITAGAPSAGIAWRAPTTQPTRYSLGASTRWLTGTTEVGGGVDHTFGDPEAWHVTAGASVGALIGPGLPFGLGITPWGRLARRGRIHGGLQLAVPTVFAFHQPAVRLPVVVEPFIGGSIGRVDVFVQGSLGQVWTSTGRAGALHAQGSVQLGIPLSKELP